MGAARWDVTHGGSALGCTQLLQHTCDGGPALAAEARSTRSSIPCAMVLTGRWPKECVWNGRRFVFTLGKLLNIPPSPCKMSERGLYVLEITLRQAK